MGATSFSNAVVARNAQEGFDFLVEEARFEHGHGGYTGTIAEKGGYGFDLITPEKGVKPLDLRKALWQADTYGDDYREGNTAGLPHPEWKPGFFVVKTPAGRKSLKGPVRLPRSNPYSDKWGPAGCLDLGPATEANLKRVNIGHRIDPRSLSRTEGKTFKAGAHLFLFFGLASE